MVTLAALTQTTLNLLYGLGFDEHPKEDTTAANLTTGATSLTPTTTSLWKMNDYAEFPVNDEVVIFAADSAGATTIRRAQLGTSDPGTTVNSGAVIRKNPPFLQYDVKQAIYEVIRADLWPHVWTVSKGSLAPTSGDYSYDLGTYVGDVTLLYQYNLNSDNRIHYLPYGWWDVEKQVNTAVSANSVLLILRRVHDYDVTVYYTAKLRPHISDLANFSSEIADLIPYAAAAKMVVKRGAQVRQSGPRTAADKDGGYAREYRNLLSEFYRMRDNLHRTLLDEVRPDKRWRPSQRAYRRSF